MDNEQVIIEKVRSALERDPRITHAEQIAVGTREGTVTLHGTVRSVHQRRTAIDVAASVPGVHALYAGLRVVDPRDHLRGDEVPGAALQAWT